MENNNKKELKIEITPEVAAGHYSNLAVISHSPNEVFIDFINMAPNMPQAKVQSRIIMPPENASASTRPPSAKSRTSSPKAATDPRATCPTPSWRELCVRTTL